jgi:septal ring factor EnvC (AmiA/AmiB activator)
MIRLHVIVLAILFQGASAGDSITRALEENRQKLETIRNEIRTLKRAIDASKARETSLLEQVKLIDKELANLSKIKQLLRRKINLLTQKTKQTRHALQTTEERLTLLNSEAAKRMIHNYKYGKVRNIELLIQSESFNQALVRYKYLHYFAEQEAQLLQSIKQEIEKYRTLEQQLADDLRNQQATFIEKEREERNFIARRAEKESIIRSIKWDRTTKNKLLSERTKNQEAIMRIIADLIQKQKEMGEEAAIPLIGEPFQKRKGKLPWPVKGNLLHTYGKQKDKTLKTTVNNTGIDIIAKSGTDVTAVYNGRISLVTYLSGYGNTIIMDHGEGYYTVYAHLDEIFVEEGQLIDENQVIGTVGESGSLEGPKLHFEIYMNNLTENPQKWLTRS